MNILADAIVAGFGEVGENSARIAIEALAVFDRVPDADFQGWIMGVESMLFAAHMTPETVNALAQLLNAEFRRTASTEQKAELYGAATDFSELLVALVAELQRSS